MKNYINFLSFKARVGQTMVEYALVVFFIAFVVILVVTLFGQHVSSTYSHINNALVS